MEWATDVFPAVKPAAKSARRPDDGSHGATVYSKPGLRFMINRLSRPSAGDAEVPGATTGPLGLLPEFRGDPLGLLRRVAGIADVVLLPMGSPQFFVRPVLRAMCRGTELHGLLSSPVTRAESTRAIELAVASGVIEEATILGRGRFESAIRSLPSLPGSEQLIEALIAFARVVSWHFPIRSYPHKGHWPAPGPFSRLFNCCASAFEHLARHAMISAAVRMRSIMIDRAYFYGVGTQSKPSADEISPSARRGCSVLNLAPN
jgi:hypothetical protein